MNDHNRKYWLKSGSYTLIMNLQAVLFGFGSFYLLVHMLDKQQFGVWALFIATTTIMEMIRGGLVQNALIQFLSYSKEEEHAEILSASYVLSSLLMLICIIVNIAIAGYLSRLWHYPPMANMFYHYTFVYIIQGILAQFQWIEQAKLSFKGILFSTTIKQAGFFVFLAFCFFKHYTPSLQLLIYIMGCFAMAGAVLQYFFVRQFLVFQFSYSYERIKKMFHYGKYVLASSISGLITNTVNQMMLGSLMSPATAGSYNVAIRITTLADLPSNSLGTIVFPQSSKRYSTLGLDSSKYLYEKSVGTILALLIPFVLFIGFFPALTIHVIAGGKYGETIPVIRLTMLTCLFNPYARMFGTILDSIGKTRYNFYVIVFFTTSELILNYFLIKSNGLMGAIYATLIANIIFFIVMQIILNRELKVNIFSTFKYALRFYPEFWKDYIRPVFTK